MTKNKDPNGSIVKEKKDLTQEKEYGKRHPEVKTRSEVSID